ncbi:MAG: hypothetical protein ACI9LM_004847 [Alteromonadaceae bacterium]|jgi:hypothetical protein
MAILLDGDCATGIPGPPVFVDVHDKYRRVGIYSGCRYRLNLAVSFTYSNIS